MVEFFLMLDRTLVTYIQPTTYNLTYYLLLYRGTATNFLSFLPVFSFNSIRFMLLSIGPTWNIPFLCFDLLCFVFFVSRIPPSESCVGSFEMVFDKRERGDMMDTKTRGCAQLEQWICEITALGTGVPG